MMHVIRKVEGVILNVFFLSASAIRIRGSRGCDHMVDGFTTTYAISAYHH